MSPDQNQIGHVDVFTSKPARYMAFAISRSELLPFSRIIAAFGRGFDIDNWFSCEVMLEKYNNAWFYNCQNALVPFRFRLFWSNKEVLNQMSLYLAMSNLLGLV
jgi:hypothetical protein